MSTICTDPMPLGDSYNPLNTLSTVDEILSQLRSNERELLVKRQARAAADERHVSDVGIMRTRPDKARPAPARTQGAGAPPVAKNCPGPSIPLCALLVSIMSKILS
jgi:hypothetical protein